MNSTIAAFALSLSWLIAGPAPAQDYPVKPIRILVGFTPGGGPDIARIARGAGIKAD